MTDTQDLLDTLDAIQVEIIKQSRLLTNPHLVDLTKLVDLTESVRQIVLNQAHNPKMDYPSVISGFIADNPLNTHTLNQLYQICTEFKEFIRS